MPNVSEKKRKLLYLLKILLEKTDGAHSLTLPQILNELESCGITAERKSIYDDIETLRSFGVEIETRKTRTFEYFIEKRRFPMSDLKLLVDAIQSAPFISGKKSAELIGKLETLCSSYQAGELRREVSVPGRARNVPGKVLAAVDGLHNAMAGNRQIKFQMLEWRLSGSGKPELAVRKGGKQLAVSPWKLVWAGDHYNLIAYDPASEKTKTFRVDQMASIELLPENREGGENTAAFEAAGQGEQEEKITLEFSSDLLGEIVERFGADIMAESAGKNKLRVTLRTVLGADFFAWLFSLGTDVKLVSPKKLAEQFRERAKAAAKLYKS